MGEPHLLQFRIGAHPDFDPGLRNIRIGPTLPAFITPNVLNVLVEKFKVMPIKTPDEDLKAILT